MKKQILAVLVGAVMGVPMIAAAQGAYVGVNVGKAKQKLSTYEDGFTLKDDATGYKLYGGYGFNQNFGIEGGYTHLGKFTDSYIDSGDAVTGTYKVRSLYLAATGTLPITEQFSIFAKVGVAFNRATISGTVNGVYEGSASENQTSPLLGIGAAYNFSKNWAVVAEYEDFGKVVKDSDGNIKARLLTVGARYSF